MGCYCYQRNIQDLLSDGKTPYEKRFGMPFNRPVIPFGAMVEYHTISAKDTSRLHQFGPKVLPRKFLGFVLSARRIWKGDLLVTDIEELEQMDASEIHPRRINAKEVLTPQRVRIFHIPSFRMVTRRIDTEGECSSSYADSKYAPIGKDEESANTAS